MTRSLSSRLARSVGGAITALRSSRQSDPARVVKLLSVEPYLADADMRLYCGDALAVLRELPDESVDCVATSPPFYGLRSYLPDDHPNKSLEIGSEGSVQDWVERLVTVFAEARRVLASHGTLWIEQGDSYAGNRSYQVSQTKHKTHDYRSSGAARVPAGLKSKDLVGQPFRLAFALQTDGWWWRSMSIWSKPDCLPESAKDRPTVAHSYVMQFSKAARYYHDAEAVREPAEWARWGDQTIVKEQSGKAGWIGPNSKEYLTQGRTTNGPRSVENRDITPGFEQRLVSADGKRNLRSVWSIPTGGYPDAHFAVWPTRLVERILLMACPAEVCRECGKPRERIVQSTRLLDGEPGLVEGGWKTNEVGQIGADGVSHWRKSTRTETKGFTDCGCGADFRPGAVLDPFAGAATTLVVARRLGRHAVGIELSEEYCEQSVKRLKTWWKDPPQCRHVDETQQSLFADQPA